MTVHVQSFHTISRENIVLRLLCYKKPMCDDIVLRPLCFCDLCASTFYGDLTTAHPESYLSTHERLYKYFRISYASTAEPGAESKKGSTQRSPTATSAIEKTAASSTAAASIISQLRHRQSSKRMRNRENVYFDSSTISKGPSTEQS